MLINVKMPTIVGILTFMSKINCVLHVFWREEIVMNGSKHGYCKYLGMLACCVSLIVKSFL